MTIVDEIVAKKKLQLAAEKKKIPAPLLEQTISIISKPPSFSKSLRNPRDVSFVFEHKPRSPSKGVLSSFGVQETVAAYGRAGASAISVLAEKNYFGGCVENVRLAAGATRLPILFKDFVFDDYQLLQARAAGASAVLLMNGVCPSIGEFLAKATGLGLECLVECTTEAQISSSLDAGAKIVGINNRDFSTLKTDLGKTAQLSPLVPSSVVLVSESGISSSKDVLAVSKSGVDSILAGSHLMKSASIEEMEEKARELVDAGKGRKVLRK